MYGERETLDGSALIAPTREDYPELYVVPPIRADVTPNVRHVPTFVMEPPSERPPIGFIASQNIDSTPTLDGLVFPVDDRTLQTYHTLQASDPTLNHALGDLRPLLEREVRIDEQGREITYQFDPISGLYTHQGYGKNSVVKPLHYEKTIDRQDHFLPPPVTNIGPTYVGHYPTFTGPLPRLQPPVSLFQ